MPGSPTWARTRDLRINSTRERGWERQQVDEAQRVPAAQPGEPTEPSQYRTKLRSDARATGKPMSIIGLRRPAIAKPNQPSRRPRHSLPLTISPALQTRSRADPRVAVTFLPRAEFDRRADGWVLLRITSDTCSSRAEAIGIDTPVSRCWPAGGAFRPSAIYYFLYGSDDPNRSAGFLVSLQVIS
jgi:hypothetical protein